VGGGGYREQGANGRLIICNLHLSRRLNENLCGHRLSFFVNIGDTQVTQLLHQPLHIYKIYKIYTSKHKNAPTCFGPKTIIRELYIPC